ncbi:MAG: EpsG family protein [Chitinophagaceae bacterium]|nr:EpsG family protein [Chitinophagaceae bacterium]MCW5905690.1 EpsG family protein [Chitinophagaceae bacterium]
MIYFWIIFLLIIALTNLDWIESYKEYKLYFAVFIGIVLVAFAGLRGDIDLDWSNYLDHYKATKLELSRGNYGYQYYIVEPLYILINQVAILLKLKFQAVIFFVATVAVSLNLICFWRYSKYFFFCVLFYFVHTYLLREMLQIRAGLACAILMLSIPYIQEKKFKPFLLLVVIAGLIHSISWVYLLVYILCLFQFSKKSYWIILLTSLFIGQFFPLGDLIFSISDINTDIVALQKVAGYYIDQEFNYALGVFKNPTLLKQLFFLVIALFYFNTLSKKIPYFRTIFNLYFLSVCWLALFNDFGLIAGRLATVFSIVEPILVTGLIYVLKPKLKFQLTYVLFIWVLASGILFYNLYIQTFIEPYKFFWEG